MTDAGPGCLAISQPGTLVTAYIQGRTVLAIARAGRTFVCTQDNGHPGGHAACDGHGHILARWPRTATEQHWQPGDHDHEVRRGAPPH